MWLQIKQRKRDKLEDEYRKAMLATELSSDACVFRPLLAVQAWHLGTTQSCSLLHTCLCGMLRLVLDRRKWSSSELENAWEVTPDRLVRCKRPDGSDWRLG